MQLTQQQIDRIYKISEWCVLGILLVMLVVLFFKPGKWFWWVSGIPLLLAMAINIVSRHWATDEEAEEFKRAVKEAVQEYKEEEKKKPKPTIFDESDIHTPLKGLTPQQEAAVHQLLQKIHVNDNGFLRNAELMAFIRALSADGNIDASDLDAVIRWIEYVSKHKVDAAHFKSEYTYRPTDKNITKMGNLIRREFDKLR